MPGMHPGDRDVPSPSRHPDDPAGSGEDPTARGTFATDLPDRSPLLTGQPTPWPEDDVDGPAPPWEPPYLDAAEHARVLELANGREVAAFVLGWRACQLRWCIEFPDPYRPEHEDTKMRVEVPKEHLAAISAALVACGATVEMYSGGLATVKLNVW